MSSGKNIDVFFNDSCIPAVRVYVITQPQRYNILKTFHKTLRQPNWFVTCQTLIYRCRFCQTIGCKYQKHSSFSHHFPV